MDDIEPELNNPQAKYWNDRFTKEGKIWGEAPCAAALEAERIFKSHRLTRILVPGCGYGRNSLFFARNGFQVVGFDISTIAIETAREDARRENLPVHYFVDDLFQFSLDGEIFEGIFSFNTLHLFLESDRKKISSWLTRALAPKGILVLTSMSTRDGDFGKGEQIARNTFESKKGRPVFYSAEEDIRDLFENQFQIEDLREIQEHENHGGRAHSNWMWFFIGSKK